MQIRRGDVWWVDFSSSKPAGGEIKKIRPAVIVSNDMSNKAMNRVQVIPLTSQIEKCYPCEAYVKVDGKQSKAMADQITTISKTRLSKRMGKIEISDLPMLNGQSKYNLICSECKTLCFSIVFHGSTEVAPEFLRFYSDKGVITTH